MGQLAFLSLFILVSIPIDINDNLTGPNGVVRMLRDAGYKVEQVKPVQ